MKVSNWGNYPVVEANVSSFDDRERLRELVVSAPTIIPRGMGRCYGDSALNERIVSTLNFNRIVAFDEQTGTITCESGVTIAELLEVFGPRGWFPPVVPGTKFITIGGAVASDIHGKNDHVEGTFCDHVLAMELMTANGRVINCSRDQETELFRLTCGGMGLAGIILTITFRLKRITSAFIREETLAAADLDNLMALFDASAEWTYSVAWLDCLAVGRRQGRGVLLRGEHVEADESVGGRTREAAGLEGLPPLRGFHMKRMVRVPLYMPGMLLNGTSVRLFNSLYYYSRHARRKKHRVIDYDTFFFPLDSIRDWNRIYGRRGFVQYQCVLPLAVSREGSRRLLNEVAKSGFGACLAVLKLLRDNANGMISFPMAGYTLALDFPIRRGLFEMLDRMDRIVIDAGGRLCLCKDARMGGDTFRRSYPNAEAFARNVRMMTANKFRSLQSDRLGITK